RAQEVGGARSAAHLRRGTGEPAPPLCGGRQGSHRRHPPPPPRRGLPPPRAPTVIAAGGACGGSPANVLRPRGFGHWLDAGPLGTLGAGPGYAMAAKLASPKSDVIIMYGDGAFGLNMMEFEACVRQKINIVGVIGNDAAWTQILRGQVQMYGPDRAPASRLSYS